jgi:hypothetical protein
MVCPWWISGAIRQLLYRESVSKTQVSAERIIVPGHVQTLNPEPEFFLRYHAAIAQAPCTNVHLKILSVVCTTNLHKNITEELLLPQRTSPFQC